MRRTLGQEDDETGWVGQRIGAYHIVRRIGVGGMGAVYEGARADGDFDKRVAIKVLRPGTESDLALQRFRFERQVLASLSHRNIAALHDGGVTPEGLPFLVMEYVDGVPITAYCDARAAGTRERVALFRQVCAAVQHAHQQLVVHRDLKPGNILVTADGTVKLLDFGIARLLRPGEGAEQLPPTLGGPRPFTPEYASPEQVRGLPPAPASDVYALGVVLYELLAGRRPLSTEGKLMAEVEQDICTLVPPPPSSHAREAPAARRVDRDLDAIVLTALAKEPERRYASGELLSADLLRWLQGQPVVARRATAGYRARKWVARHRVAVAAVALAVTALGGGIVGSVRQARRARMEAAKFAEVNGLLANMLAAPDPGAQGKDVTVRQVLDRSAQDVKQRRLSPEVEAQVRHTIAQTYSGLGLFDSARVHAERAFALRRDLYGLRNDLTLYSLSYVVQAVEALGHYAEAESLARVSVREWKAMQPPRPEEVSNALDMLARLVELQGRMDESRTLKLSSLDLRRPAARDSAGRAKLALTLANLSASFAYAGQPARAESLAREGVALAWESPGPRSQRYGDLLEMLASTVSEQGRHHEADTLSRRAIAVLREALGAEHPAYLRAWFIRAQLRQSAGDARGALEAANQVVPHLGTIIPTGDQTGHAVLQVQGLALDSLGRHAEAEVALQRSLALRRALLPAGHWAVASSESVLGGHFLLVGRLGEAERLLTGAYPRLVAARGAEAEVSRLTAARLARVYGAMGRPADSLAWARKGMGGS